MHVRPVSSARLVALSIGLFGAAAMIVSCGSNTPPISCGLPANGAGTCTCGADGSTACPAQVNQTLYASGSSGDLFAFSIDDSTGALSGPISTISGAGGAGMADVNGQFLFTSDQSNDQLDGYSIAEGGSLAVLPGSPFTIGHPSTPRGLVSPTGSNFLYVADGLAVDAFTVDSSGVPTAIAGSPFAGANFSLTTDASGKFLYTAVDIPAGIVGFTIGSNGALTAMADSPFALPGQTIAGMFPGIVANGSFVYVVLSGADQIAGFSINSSSGALTPIAGSPFPVSGIPTALAVTNDYLYVSNAESLSGYSIDASTGALTEVEGSPFSIFGSVLATDYTGQYLYASAGLGIFGYSIDAATGNLTPIGGLSILTVTSGLLSGLNP